MKEAASVLHAAKGCRYFFAISRQSWSSGRIRKDRVLGAASMELGRGARPAAAPRNDCPTAHHQRSDGPTARCIHPHDAADATGYRSVKT